MKKLFLLLILAAASIGCPAQSYSSSERLVSETIRKNGDIMYRVTYPNYIRLDKHTDAAICMRGISAYGMRESDCAFSLTLFSQKSKALHRLALEAWDTKVRRNAVITFTNGSSTSMGCELANNGTGHSKNTNSSVIEVNLLPGSANQIDALASQDIRSIRIGNTAIQFNVFNNSSGLFNSLVSAYRTLSPLEDE